MRGPVAAVLALACACSASGAQRYEPGHLPQLVLDRAPAGTTGDEARTIGLEDVAQGDATRRTRFEGAGFVSAYETRFRASGFSDPARSAFMLSSRAYLFEDAGAGLASIRSVIEADAGELESRASPFEDRPGFVFTGEIDESLPDGIVIAWTKRNVVLVLAAVATAEIDVIELRTLARTIDGLEPSGTRP